MPRFTRPMRPFALTISALIAAVTITACGSNGSTATAGPSPTTRSSHNAADVSFAQSMIPHHRQAVTMAGYAVTRASSPEVKTLAGQIAKAQNPEIVTMAGWLRAWGQPTPTAGSSTPGMDMGATPGMTMSSGADDRSDMPSGVMSDQDMMTLQESTGKAFDRMFLTMMISHHSGALMMAATELRDGSYGPAKHLARSIETSQTAEITTMKKLLAGG